MNKFINDKWMMKMNKITKIYTKFICICITVCGLCLTNLSAKEVTDMTGRKVIVPDKITRLFSMNISATYMIYAIDPDLFAGLTMGVRDSEKKYFRKSFCDLPVVGGTPGSGQSMNLELILKLKPDVIIVWGKDGDYEKIADKITDLKIPVVAVDVNGLAVYADTFTFLGKLLDREKRASELADYTKKILSELKGYAARIPDEKRVYVYNTRDREGLNTACEGSLHSELIPLAGGINSVKCMTGLYGMQKINMEQLMLINPDAIVAMNSGFVENVYRDKLWQNIKAIKTKRVYLAPRSPVNWWDGPPSFMGILGLQWLTNKLYPEYYQKDVEKEAQYFIKLFFGIELSKEEIRKIIAGV